MLITLKVWLKSSNSPFAKVMLKIAKQIRNPQCVVIPFLHSFLYQVHTSTKDFISFLFQAFYFTPIFKSQVSGTKKNLQLYSGMPQILGQLDIEIGNDVRMSGITTFCGRISEKRTAKLVIGNNTDIGWQNAFSVGTNIIIEDDVRLAGRVFLAGFPGHPEDIERRANGEPDDENQIGDIVIKRGAWIGTGVTIIGNVTIGEGAIVAASSVVTKDVKPFSLVAGNPVKEIRKVESNV